MQFCELCAHIVIHTVHTRIIELLYEWYTIQFVLNVDNATTTDFFVVLMYGLGGRACWYMQSNVFLHFCMVLLLSEVLAVR